jgi:hypothetical protein
MRVIKNESKYDYLIICSKLEWLFNISGRGLEPTITYSGLQVAPLR